MDCIVWMTGSEYVTPTLFDLAAASVNASIENGTVLLGSPIGMPLHPVLSLLDLEERLQAFETAKDCEEETIMRVTLGVTMIMSGVGDRILFENLQWLCNETCVTPSTCLDSDDGNLFDKFVRTLLWTSWMRVAEAQAAAVADGGENSKAGWSSAIQYLENHLPLNDDEVAALHLAHAQRILGEKKNETDQGPPRGNGGQIGRNYESILKKKKKKKTAPVGWKPKGPQTQGIPLISKTGPPPPGGKPPAFFVLPFGEGFKFGPPLWGKNPWGP
eukprot:FR740443.1.p1 GENE.FR740443.1~~FR740443.1.p1  ORF type:complete len:273 (+),score=73.79 FR740443.1:370-1188(+)